MKENAVSLIILVGTLGVACGGAGGTPGEPSGGEGLGSIDNPASATLASTLLSSVSLDNGETVEFRAYGPDRVAIVDTFKQRQPHAVPANAEKMTLSEVYSSVTGGKTVPTAIGDADQQFAAAKSAQPATAQIPPPPAHDTTPPSPAFYDFNSWFQPTFCPSADYCGSATGSFVFGPWRWAYSYTETGGLDGAATSPAYLYTETWLGTIVTGLGSPATVPPGYAVTITFNFSNPTWFYGYLSQASGGVEEDLAERGPFNNSWSVLGPMGGSNDIRYYTGDGAWGGTNNGNPNRTFECGGGVDAIGGISSFGAPSCDYLNCNRAETVDLLCATLPQPLVYGSGYTINFDDRRDTSTGDWAPGLHYAECGPNDAIVGLSQIPETTWAGQYLQHARCAPISRMAGAINCNAEYFGGSPNSGFSTNGQEPSDRGDWDYGFYKGECSPGRYVKGVAKDSSQSSGIGTNTTGDRIVMILCCSPTTNATH